MSLPGSPPARGLPPPGTGCGSPEPPAEGRPGTAPTTASGVGGALGAETGASAPPGPGTTGASGLPSGTGAAAAPGGLGPPAGPEPPPDSGSCGATPSRSGAGSWPAPPSPPSVSAPSPGGVCAPAPPWAPPVPAGLASHAWSAGFQEHFAGRCPHRRFVCLPSQTPVACRHAPPPPAFDQKHAASLRQAGAARPAQAPLGGDTGGVPTPGTEPGPSAPSSPGVVDPSPGCSGPPASAGSVVLGVPSSVPDEGGPHVGSSGSQSTAPGAGPGSWGSGA